MYYFLINLLKLGVLMILKGLDLSLVSIGFLLNKNPSHLDNPKDDLILMCLTL